MKISVAMPITESMHNYKHAYGHRVKPICLYMNFIYLNLLGGILLDTAFLCGRIMLKHITAYILPPAPMLLSYT